MPKTPDLDGQKKRARVQRYFWDIVGSAEHINVPKLEDALKKQFQTNDGRVIEAQIRLMQTEGRIRVQANNKVWIKQPPKEDGSV
jgi:hypothetical protein